MSGFVDITTSTPNTTNVKRGDYNAATASLFTVNKAQGASTAIRRGYALSRSTAVTPNVFAVTTTQVDETVVIAGLPFTTKESNINIGGSGEDISAEDDDAKVNAIIKGRVVVKLAGTGQPGEEVMTAANGEFVAYDGLAGPEFIKGTFIGLPGAGFDASVIAQGWTAGQLGVIEFDGGA